MLRFGFEKNNLFLFNNLEADLYKDYIQRNCLNFNQEKFKYKI